MVAQESTVGEQSFAGAYAAYYDQMIRLALVTTGSVAAAEDVVQDAFVALYRSWDEVAEPGAWLRRVVVNRSTSWLRRLAVARRYAARAVPGTAQPPPTADDAAVRAALRRLRPRQRAAVFLRFYLDQSEAQIAETLGCPPGTVKSLLHRGLATLKEHLNER
jgi:RNA polymerase sigma-70 factor (sigma-E family)